METLVDVVGLALVAKVTLAIVVQEILVEGFGEVGSLLDAGLLQGDIYLSVDGLFRCSPSSCHPYGCTGRSGPDRGDPDTGCR